MPKVAIVWSGLQEDDEEATTLHEERLIPAAIAKNEPTARNGERIEESPFQEVTQINGNHMAFFDLSEDQSIDDFDARIRTSIGEVPDNARLNARCYDQYARFDGEYWRDDPRDVRMVCVVMWQPAADAHDEIVDWFINEFIPGMLDSPELLRTRMFKLEHASNIRGQKSEQLDKNSLKQYMTIWEFETEEFPWEVLVYLGSSEKWRLYVEDAKMDWEIGQYLEYWQDDERNGVQNSSDEETDQEEDDSDPYEVR